MIELNKIYNEDCLETMKRMEDDVIDLVITSPLMGTGTTAIVANNMNRKYIGSEITKDYFDLIESKIKSEKANIISKGLF